MIKKCYLLCFVMALFAVSCGDTGIDSISSLTTQQQAVSATTTPPSAPTLLAVVAGDKTNTLTWKSGSNATSYALYWSIAPGVTVANGTKISSVTSPYPHTGLTNETTYYYIVTSVNAAGESGASGSVSAAPSSTVVAESSSVVVAASPASVNVSSATTITATVTDSTGAAIVDGSDVTFTISNPATGSFTDDTDVLVVKTTGGVATVVFTAGAQADSAVITATAGVASNSVKVDIKVAPASATISASPAQLTVLGTSSISMSIIDNAGNPIPAGTMVQYQVNDTALGTIHETAYTVWSTDADGKIQSIATNTFISNNLPGSATVSAKVGELDYFVSIPISAADTASIEFIKAEPMVIGVQGSGQPETSDFSFMVRDSNGNSVVDGISVVFSFTGPGGGEKLSSTTGSTVNGVAVVTLQSGFVSGPVRVTAQVVGLTPAVITSSAGASIGGGKPSGNHFDLASSIINLAGLAYTNVETDVSAYLADRFGNYNVLENTSVSFYTEAGALDRSGVTDKSGALTVKLRTQVPNPVDTIPAQGIFSNTAPFSTEGSYDDIVKLYKNNPRDGWVTVLATTRGEEGFNDANGNGVYDTGETFIDLPEPFIDKNDNNVRDDGSQGDDVFEEFVDVNLNGIYDGSNNKWDNDITIFKEMKIVFSGAPDFSSNTSRIEPSQFFTVLAGGCVNLTAYISDANMNRITAGSKITFSTNINKVVGGGELIIGDGLSTGPTVVSFAICDATRDVTATQFTGYVSATVSVKIEWNSPGGAIITTMGLNGQLENFVVPQ